MAVSRALAALLALLALAASAPTTRVSGNMNGFPYAIANPHPNGLWTGEYLTLDPSAGASPLEYFDVYSPPITTRYAQVFWTALDEVPLPADVVARFQNKTMAIRGYECNQVMKGAAADGKGDIAVPISAAYNHHHTAYIKAAHTELRRVPVVPGDPLLLHGHGGTGTNEVWQKRQRWWQRCRQRRNGTLGRQQKERGG